MNEFDQHAGDYTEKINESIGFSGLNHDFFTALKAAEIKKSVPRSCEKGVVQLLDVGCGIGGIHRFLSDRIDRITGVDVSQTSIDIATRNNPNSKFFHYDGNTLPFPDGTFDIAMAICVVHHVKLDKRSGFFLELSRVLRQGGVAIILEHNPLNPVTRYVVSRCEFDEDAILLGARECGRLMSTVGLMPSRARYIATFPFDVPLLRHVEKWLDAIPLGAQYVMVGRRAT